MDRLNAGMLKAPERPVRVLQFGEGNFLPVSYTHLTLPTIYSV